MNEKTVDLVALAFLLLTLAVTFMVAHQRDSLKQEAVDRGFAEWHIIEGTAETEFRWKEAP